MNFSTNYRLTEQQSPVEKLAHNETAFTDTQAGSTILEKEDNGRINRAPWCPPTSSIQCLHEPDLNCRPTKSSNYHIFKVVVSKRFRDLVGSIYPGLGNDKRYWSFLQLLLFHQSIEERGYILPEGLIRAAFNYYSHKRSAISMIEEFQQATGIEMTISDISYEMRYARVVTPVIDETVLAALSVECTIPVADKVDQVFFTTGKPANESSVGKEIREHDNYLVKLSRSIQKGHPAYELVHYLLSQPAKRHESMIVEAAGRLLRAIQNNTDWSPEKKLFFLDQVSQIEQFGRIRYKSSEKTPRIFAIGVTVAGLPKCLRQLVFSGCVEFDLKSAQLAIAAKMWPLPDTHKFLADGGDIWNELARHCQVDKALAKPTLKKGVYSMVYGMGEQNLFDLLANGNNEVPGLGEEAAIRFFNHWIIKEALFARKLQLQQITKSKGAWDAFDRFIQMPWVRRKRKKHRMPNPSSVLAQIAQSWELKIMLSILPILKTNRQIHLMLWLHDGITLRFANSSKADRWKRQIEKTINSCCRKWGIPSHVEIEEIPQFMPSSMAA